jgi:uncharacterized protein GlcG (DUF336 family)
MPRALACLTAILMPLAMIPAAALPAFPADSLIITHRIPASLAVEAVIAGVKACAAKGYDESVVVVDAAGNPQASLRGDGAGIHSLENAEHKAYTAVALKLDTSVVVERSKKGGDVSPAINRLPRMILAEGGVVIKYNDEVIGGIGASGAPGGEKDDACARAALAAITDKLK